MANNSSLPTSDPSLSVRSSEIVENSRIAITETTSDAIITINEDSIIQFANPAVEKVFGYSPDELLGSDLTLLMPDYLRYLHKSGLKNYVETGTKHIAWESVELPGLHKNGEEIPLELCFGEFRVDGQRFFTGIARDISGRKSYERRLALQHSVAEILSESRTLDEAAPRFLSSICATLDWQFGALWAITSENNKLSLITSWRESSSPLTEEFESASVEPSYDPESGFLGRVLRLKEPIWITDFGQQTFPRSSVAARGNLQSAFGFPVLLGNEVLGVIELFASKTKTPEPTMLSTLIAIGNQIGQFLKRLEKERESVNAVAREHEARLDAERLSTRLSALQRITHAALGHLTVDLVMSESLKRIREVIDVDTVAILLLEEEANELVAWAAQGLEEEVEQGVRIPVGKGFAGRVVAGRKPLIIPNLDEADVLNPLLREKGIKSLLGVPLLVEGRPTGVLHVGKMQLTTFTEEQVTLLELAADRIALAIENARLYQVEQRARAEAEAANSAKDEFLTILSHELRTPLTPIIGWIHMMETGILKEDEFQRVLSVINRNAYGLKRLINDLLDMSAIMTGKMRINEAPVSISGVLEETVETMRSYAGDSKVSLQLQIEAEPEELVVQGDRSRLHQAFCNILHNAIKFSSQNGVVSITARATDKDVVIDFTDQGTGIPAEFRPFVFDRFRQADGSRTRTFGGLGLGLALVKSFVEAHRGTVDVISEGEGKGTTFLITLPRQLQVDKEASRNEAKPEPKHNRPAKRVLLVEDQPDTLEMLTLSLQQSGFEVVPCRSAQEALVAVDREHIDILISDIGMPSMDGLQLIRSLRQGRSQEQLPAIALSGYASNSDIKATIAAGFNRHLSKPIDPALLIDEIEILLNLVKEKGIDAI